MREKEIGKETKRERESTEGKRQQESKEKERQRVRMRERERDRKRVSETQRDELPQFRAARSAASDALVSAMRARAIVTTRTLQCTELRTGRVLVP